MLEFPREPSCASDIEVLPNLWIEFNHTAQLYIAEGDRKQWILVEDLPAEILDAPLLAAEHPIMQLPVWDFNYAMVLKAPTLRSVAEAVHFLAEEPLTVEQKREIQPNLVPRYWETLQEPITLADVLTHMVLTGPLVACARLINGSEFTFLEMTPNSYSSYVANDSDSGEEFV